MTDTPAPPDSYAALSEHMADVIARVRSVTIDGKPMLLLGDLAFLEHVENELGALDHIIQTLTYQSMASASGAVHDRQRADFLQASNVDLEERARRAEASTRTVVALTERAVTAAEAAGETVERMTPTPEKIEKGAAVLSRRTHMSERDAFDAVVAVLEAVLNA